MNNKEGIVLVGHGSMVSEDATQVVYALASRLRKLGRWTQVEVAFWKQSPTLADAIVQMATPSVTIVPMFMAQGYFTQIVLPREFAKPSARFIGHQVQMLSPIGAHPAMCDVIQSRIDEVLLRDDVQGDDCTVVLVGHGTRRHAKSSALIWAHRETIEQRDVVASVKAAFLDESPTLEAVIEQVDTAEVIVIPYLLANGYHTTMDIPALLGISFGDASSIVGDRRVWYGGAIGQDESMLDVVLSCLERQDVQWHAIGYGFYRWRHLVVPYLKHWLRAGVWTFGQLAVSQADVGGFYLCHENEDSDHCQMLDCDDVAGFLSKDEDGQWRALQFGTNLRRGWCALVPTVDALIVLIDQIYPSALLHRVLWQQGQLNVDSIEQTLNSQSGRYAQLKDVSPSQFVEMSSIVCQKCAKSPVWAGQRAESMVCGAMCHWMMEAVLDDVL